MKCPSCNGPARYQAFSGGREASCEDYEGCMWQGAIEQALEPDEAMPRATLLRTESGRIALRAQMDQELARRRDEATR